MLHNHRQEKFAIYCASGKTQIEAAKLAGYKDNNYLKSNVSKLIKQEAVAKRIEELKNEFVSEVKEKIVLTRDFLLDKLAEIILTGTDRNKIAGISLAAKLQGYMTEDINLNVNKTVEDLSDEQLIRMLDRTNTDQSVTNN